jgi:hypothetical protein
LEGCKASFARKNKKENPSAARLWERGITQGNDKSIINLSYFSYLIYHMIKVVKLRCYSVAEFEQITIVLQYAI